MHLDSILTACDFSSDARHAAQRAAMICASAGATRGVALHVLESSRLDSIKRLINLPADADQAITDGASHGLQELVAEIQARTGFALEPQVRVGNIINTIVEASARFDLLALGARGTHPLRESMLGTTAERLLRQTRKPVLVVRSEPTSSYRRILVAVDFSPGSQAALACARAVADDADLHLVHVSEVPFADQMRYSGISDAMIKEYRSKAQEEADTEMARFVAAAGEPTGRLHPVVEYDGNVVNRLVEKAQDVDAELIVVGKHGRTLTERLLMGSVTYHLLAECSCDILVTQ